MANKKSEISNVPNLRFPGFERQWEVRKIGELGEFIGGGTPDSNNVEYWEGNIPWISSSDVFEGSIHLINKTRFITENAIKLSATKKVPKGSILIVSRVGIGKFAVADCELCTSQDFTNLISTENEYFLGYYFSGRTNRFLSLSQGTSIKGFTSKDIKLAEFLIPSLDEQIKIAQLLSLIDTRIQTQNKIIEQLETLMHGIREKVFVQKLKFKDNIENRFSEWRIDKLGNLGTFFSGGTPLTTTKHYYDGIIPFIKSGEIHNAFTEQFITEEGLKNSSAKLVDTGDLLYALYGATSGEVAISKIKGAINQAILCIKTDLNANYLLNYLIYQKVNIIQTYLQGGQGNLSAEIIKSIKIPVPSTEEQNLISNMFFSINQKIQTEKALLERLEMQKKYLLQQMFI